MALFNRSLHNIGGVKRLFAIQKHLVQSIPTPIQNRVTQDITLVEGATWNEIVFTRNKPIYKTDIKRTAHGYIYESEIISASPSVNYLSSADIDFLQYKDLLIIVETNNNARILIGANSRGVEIQSAEYNVEGQPDSFSNTTVKLYTEESKSPIFYEGSINGVPLIYPILAYHRTVEIMGLFAESQAELTGLVLGSDKSGRYNSIEDDGSSGTLTISVNGSAYAPFAAPLYLKQGDTLAVKRTTTTTNGYFKLIGIY